MAAGSERWTLAWIKKVNRNGEERTFFDNVGVAFKNKNGSFNIYIEKMPTVIDKDTVFNLAPFKPKEKVEEGGFEE